MPQPEPHSTAAIPPQSVPGATVALLALALLAGGCATQQQTGKTLAAVGVAAMLVGAAIADDHCEERLPDDPVQPPCHRRQSKKQRNASAGLIIAGAGAAAVGELLHDNNPGPDRTRRVRPTAQGNPWRLPERAPKKKTGPESQPDQQTPSSSACRETSPPLSQE